MKTLPPIVFASPLMAFANFDSHTASINLIRLKKQTRGAAFAIYSTVPGIEGSLHKTEEQARDRYCRNIAQALINGHRIENYGICK